MYLLCETIDANAIDVFFAPEDIGGALTRMQLILNELLERFALVVSHGICLGADGCHSDFLAQLLDEFSVHGRESMGRNEVKAQVDQQIIPGFSQRIPFWKDALQPGPMLSMVVCWDLATADHSGQSGA